MDMVYILSLCWKGVKVVDSIDLGFLCIFNIQVLDAMKHALTMGI